MEVNPANKEVPANHEMNENSVSFVELEIESIVIHLFFL